MLCFYLRRAMALFVLRCLLPVLLVTCSVAEVTFLRVDRAVVEQRLKKLPKTPLDRLHMLRAEFVKAGCPKVREQHIFGEQLPNVLCTVPGTAKSGTIVVSAPIDYKNEGDDAVVGWAGLLTLPMLAEAINSTTHHSTYVLAAFAGDDNGVSGAKWYLSQLVPGEREQLRAVVALNQIGRSPAKYALPWVEKRKDLETVYGRVVLGHPTTERDVSPLTRMLEVAADALKVEKIPLEETPEEYDDIERNEASYFSSQKIPAITVHSMAYRTIPRIGGTDIKLQRTAIDLKSYYETYTLLSVYALLLDKALDPPSGKREVMVASGEQKADKKALTATAPTQVASQAQAGPTQAPSTTPEATTAAPAAPAAVTEETVLQAIPGQAPSAPPIFRSSVQLVQVDVVATDKDGRPINDLKASDFTVLQDGVAREIRAFEPHSLLPPASAKPADVKLPENTFTNLPDSDYDEARIILLFDMLNTPVQDQQFAQKQLMKVLKDLPAERRIAIFALSEKLVLVQGFTNDRQLLVEAAESIGGQRSHQYLGALQRQQRMGGAQGLQRATRPAVTMPAAAGGAVPPPDLTVLGAPKQNVIRDEESFLTTARVQFTIDAFKGLARGVSGYPGRKSVLWISGGFPISISPDPELETATRGAENYREQLAQTSRLLATSRIAMYPIDVRGIQPRGIDITLSTMESEGMLEMRQPVNSRSGTGGTLEAGSSGLANVLNQQSKLYAHERSTLLNIAHDTGGRAFIGSNNIREAITRGVQDAATYYTLAYEPDKTAQSEMKYHNLEVKVARPDVRLTYRRGYYSLPQEPISPEIGVAALRGSLQPGMPPATSLYLTAKVSPPVQPGKPVRVDYIINTNGVTFSDAQNSTKRAVVDCMVVAYDQEGREVSHASDTLDATIPMNQYDWVLRRGLPANQEIMLKPGAYNLRLGVMDRTSQQIGTLDVPLIIPSS
jgi:VWFA-related protein